MTRPDSTVTETALCDAELADDRAACAFELPAGEVPDWIALVPAGQFTPRDGRSAWTNDRPDAVVAASRALAMDLPVDYEHQTEYAPKNGQPAPAAGWVKELAVRDGAIWGRVEWNERARAMLAAREYRFISPVFEFEKKSRRVARIRSVALTNTPALYLTAIARQEESHMDPKLKAVLDALGLGNDADKDAVEKALARLTACATALATVAKAAGADEKAAPADIATALCAAIEASKADGKLTAIAKAAGLKETATPEEIATAVATARAGGGDPDPSKYVPRSEFDQVKTALATLQSDSAEEKATAAADEAIADGKVTPAQRDWAVAYARKDAEGFAEYVKTAPVIVKPGSTSTAKAAARSTGALDETERAVCRAMGLSEEDFKKSRAQLADNDEEAA